MDDARSPQRLVLALAILCLAGCNDPYRYQAGATCSAAMAPARTAQDSAAIGALYPVNAGISCAEVLSFVVKVPRVH